MIHTYDKKLREAVSSSSVCDWRFIAEGGANIIFAYKGRNPVLHGKALRLRRRKTKSEMFTSLETLNFMRDFGKDMAGFLVDAALVDLKTELVSALKSCYDIADDLHGLILENVLSDSHESHKLSKHAWFHIVHDNDSKRVSRIIIEFKPKWLTKADNIYCRNCSLSQMRDEKRHFCPLDLVFDQAIRAGVFDLLQALHPSVRARIGQAYVIVGKVLIDYLLGQNSVLKRLRDLQQQFPTYELSKLSSAEEVSEELRKGMSLRDVGVYLEIYHASRRSMFVAAQESFYSTEYEVRPIIFDLDPKSATRFEHWKTTELRLQEFCNSPNRYWKPCAEG
ncbi:Inositol-pentakisphosphate 2-kinase [Candidozyma auris]|nr:hypothetical protein QG37_03740 [[Candida] auris]